MEEIDLNLTPENYTNEYASKLIEAYNNTRDIKYADKLLDCLNSGKITLIKASGLSALSNQIQTESGTVSLLKLIVDLKIKIDDKLLGNIIYQIPDFFGNNENYLFDLEIEGMSVAEFMLNNFIFEEKYVSYIRRHPEIIKLLVKNNRIIWSSKCTEELLFDQQIDGVRVIDYLFQNGLFQDDTVLKIKYNHEILEILEKYNRVDLFKKVDKSILSSPYKGFDSVLEYMISINANINGMIKTEKDVVTLYNNKRYDILATLNDVGLLVTLPNGKKVLEVLLSVGIVPKAMKFTKKEIFDILLKYGFEDVICDAPIDKLLLLDDLNNSYLDLLIKRMKDGVYVPLGKIKSLDGEPNKIAQFYIKMAENGLIDYISPLTSKILMEEKNGTKLIDELLKENQDVTLNIILDDDLKSKVDISMYLRVLGLASPNARYTFIHNEFLNDYISKVNKQYKDIQVDEGAQKLIDELRQVLLSDKKSSIELVELLCDSYKYLLSSGNPIAVQEIRRVIEIKKANPDFAIVQNSSCYYQTSEKTVNVSKPIVGIINHEMGHALFHLTTDERVPEGFSRITTQLRRDPKMIDRVQTFSVKYHEIKREIAEKLEKTYMIDYDNSITDEKKEKLQKKLDNLKNKKYDSYLKKGWTKEQLDAIFADEFNLEEYLEEERSTVKDELVDAVLRCKYPELCLIGDILDAIYIGRFAENILVDNRGNPIERGYGHGIYYYDRGVDWIFDEIVAQFSLLLKSPTAGQAIPFLRTIVGDEFVDYMINYYYREIVTSTKNQEKENQRSV